MDIMSISGEVLAGYLLIALGISFVTCVLLLKRGYYMDKKPKFEIFKDQEQKFRFRLKAPNGEIICQSEAYESKQGCIDTVNVLGDYAKKATLVDLT